MSDGGGLRVLRGIAVRRDRDALVELLAAGRPSLLQHTGEALLAVGIEGLEEAARDVERRLRERDDRGDDLLADLLASRLGGPAPLGRRVRADLGQVEDLISGDLQRERGGWLDVQTGDCRSATELDGLGEDEGLDVESEPDRWVWLDCDGSRDRWQDRYAFAAHVPPGRLRERLLEALDGRGAFRRFARVLDDEPDVLVDWRGFSAERAHGRARAALAERGCVAVP